MSTIDTKPLPPLLPQPPRKPEPHECCGTGCIPCVMDIYEEELWEYERSLKQLQGQPQVQEQGQPQEQPQAANSTEGNAR